MLQKQWDDTINTEREFVVNFSVKHSSNVLHRDTLTMVAKSFVEAAKKFVMEAIQVVSYEVLKRNEDSSVNALITFKVGPDYKESVEVRVADQYAALHTITTEVVTVEKITDSALDG